MQVVALDFGPVGEADVTANLMAYAPCGPVRHEVAEAPHDPDALPYLHIKSPHHGAASDVLAQVPANTRQLHELPDASLQNLAALICINAHDHDMLHNVCA